MAVVTRRWPAEWEPHAATWLAWPHRESDWPGKFAPIPWVYAEIIRHLHRSELLNLLVNDSAVEGPESLTVVLPPGEYYMVVTDCAGRPIDYSLCAAVGASCSLPAGFMISSATAAVRSSISSRP